MLVTFEQCLQLLTFVQTFMFSWVLGNWAIRVFILDCKHAQYCSEELAKSEVRAPPPSDKGRDDVWCLWCLLKNWIKDNLDAFFMNHSSISVFLLAPSFSSWKAPAALLIQAGTQTWRAKCEATCELQSSRQDPGLSSSWGQREKSCTRIGQKHCAGHSKWNEWHDAEKHVVRISRGKKGVQKPHHAIWINL